MTYRKLHCCLLLSAACLLATVARGRSPEETLEEYVAAVQQQGMSAIAKFADPTELASFRASMEPAILARLKDKRTRQQFASFVDPYDRNKIRPFRDDADFTAVFINWMSTSGGMRMPNFQDTTVKPLGHVDEGDLRHVVARLIFKNGDKTAEQVMVTTMVMREGQPMLQLPPELRQIAESIRQTKGN